MNRHILFCVVLLTVLLTAYFSSSFRVFSSMTNENTTNFVSRILTSENLTSECEGTVESMATFYRVLNVNGEEINVTLTCFDIILNETKFMKVRVICNVESNIFIMETPNILLEQNETFSANTLISTQTLSNDSPVRYNWDGVTFISTDSRPLYVKYDHPDNGPYNPPTYPIPVDEAEATVLRTKSGKLITHIPKHSVDEMEQDSSFFKISGWLARGVAVLLAIPEAFISKLVASIAVIFSLICDYLGWSYAEWVNNVVRTEMGDGWQYIWGTGSWWIFYWFYYSYGKDRDNGSFFMWIGNVDDYILGDTNGDKIVDSIDLGMVYSELGCWHPACDLNFDGKVNYVDFSLEFGYYLGWQTRYFKYAPPIETAAASFGQAVSTLCRKYP